MRKNFQSGFTLIELIVAVTIFILLILAAGTLYVTVVRQQVDDRLTQSLQRESDRVTAHLERNVAEATGVAGVSACNVESVDQITLATDGGPVTYQRNGAQVEFGKGGAVENLLSPSVSASGVRFFPTCDGTALVALRFEATLAKSAAGQTETVDISTSVGTRPQ
ncbi:MAG: prepilin-type N-terminal cleavage/methylation domain-containing protein [Patescibacteria group bacterium]